MATTGPPFDKPMDELREAFVRARFAQDDVFGLAEIETWLKHQRAQEHPDEIAWQQFLAHEFIAMCAATAPTTHLRERATASRFTSATFRSLERMVELYAPLLAALDGHSLSRIAMYYGTERMVLVVGTEYHDGAAYVIEKGYGTGHPSGLPVDSANLVFTPFSTDKMRAARSVVDVLFAEWDRQRPKWSEAREFLCNALAEEIKRERAKAEQDFDSAVAVSADGTKIVHADWVVVVPKSLPHPLSERWVPRSTMIVFPSAAFRAQKILKSNERMRLEPHYDPYSHRITHAEEAGRAAAEQFAIVMRSPEPSQAFGYLDKGGHGQGFRDACLITTANFCPSPLPDGGVEVTV